MSKNQVVVMEDIDLGLPQLKLETFMGPYGHCMGELTQCDYPTAIAFKLSDVASQDWKYEQVLGGLDVGEMGIDQIRRRQNKDRIKRKLEEK
jgi:hypothetical protein